MPNALDRLGRLYRNDEGVEVWRIVGLEGELVAEDVASDHDAAWIAENVYRDAGLAD